MTTPQGASASPSALLNVAAVADRLGVDIRHVRRLVLERRIPFIKWGSLLRFDPTEIDTWIDTSVASTGPSTQMISCAEASSEKSGVSCELVTILG